jgi:hypothetical protein
LVAAQTPQSRERLASRPHAARYCHCGVQRERLLNRRLPEVVQFGLYVADIGRFDDGRLAEVFLTAAKTDTGVEASARDAAIIASLAFQYGRDEAAAASSDGSRLPKSNSRRSTNEPTGL